MADHGEVEYATAEGNDYKEHVGTYELFLKITVVGIIYVACIVVALTLGGVLGHWFLAAAVLIISTITAAIGLVFGKNAPSLVVLLLSLLAIPLTA